MVRSKAITYCLTWFRFHVSLVPNVMAKVLKRFLRMMEQVTHSYVDDIFVDAGVATAEEIVDHQK